MPTNNESKAVMLPCGPDEFRDFIRSLLGKPQSITNRFSGAFDLERQDLEQFHYLLIDRMAQQNKVQLAMFTARVQYDDDSSVQVNDFEAFKTYNEVKPVVSTAAHLSWEFMVTFEDRTAPEKQEVDISFLTEGPFHMIDKFEGHVVRIGSGDSFGAIAYRINHTARTWASDIDALLSAHIKAVLPSVPPWRKWIASHSEAIGLFTFLLLFLSSVATLVQVSDSFWNTTRDTLTHSVAAQVEVAQKIHLIAQQVASGAGERFQARCIAFSAVALVVSVAIAIWAGASAGGSKPAFLCLTRKSREAKAQALKKAQRRFLSFCLSLLAAIICSALGNYLFAFCIRVWKP